MKKVLAYLFGVMVLISAFNHIFAPESYSAMIPSFVSPLVANMLAAIAEFVIGIALFIPRFRAWGALLFTALMVAFLPIHIWDLVRENPAIGEPPAPIIRLVIQLLVIYAGYWLYKKWL